MTIILSPAYSCYFFFLVHSVDALVRLLVTSAYCILYAVCGMQLCEAWSLFTRMMTEYRNKYFK